MTDTNTLGLYLHIPWCPTRCVYCDFNTYLEGEAKLKTRYHNALLREIQQSGEALERPTVSTIYIGGGTPTTLSSDRLLELVAAVKASFDLAAEAEVTVEANPGGLSTPYLSQLCQGGINRLSLGVQSFVDEELHFLSRRHDAQTARQAMAQARQAGFDNVNLDLILNLPRQPLAHWRYNLQEAVKLAPEHLSLYTLIIEPGTPLQQEMARGRIPQPDEDAAADMYACALDTLEAAGYSHYEISNWARDDGGAAWQTPGLASAHNLIYWRNQSYLGLGAGAYGTIQVTSPNAPRPDTQRWMNVKRPQRYIERIEVGAGLGAARAEESFERIDRTTAMFEQVLLGLRLVREGIGAAEFESRFGVSLEEQYPQAVAYGLEQGLAEWLETPEGARFRLTKQGRFVANQVIFHFMP